MKNALPLFASLITHKLMNRGKNRALCVTLAAALFLSASPALGEESKLLSAAANGDLPSVAQGYLGGAEPADSYGNTPLLLASENGFAEVVKLLLERGASPNRANSYGYTPLFSAVVNRHAEVIKLLVANGADLTLTNSFRSSPLDYVGALGFTSMPAYLEYLAETKEPPLSGPNSHKYMNDWQKRVYACGKDRSCVDKALRGAAGKSDPDACYLMGKSLLEKDAISAERYLIIAAEAGNADAAYLLGRMYTDGYSPKDSKLGFGYLQKAASPAQCSSEVSTHLSAVLLLGRAYMLGEGVEADGGKAMECFNRTEKQENYDGLYFKGIMKYYGLGAQKDVPLGLKEINAAAVLKSQLAEEQIRRFTAWEVFNQLKPKKVKGEAHTLLLSTGVRFIGNGEGDCELFNISNLVKASGQSALTICYQNQTIDITAQELDPLYKSFLLNYDRQEEIKFFAR